MKKFMACLLVLCMMLGTCTSAFATVLTEDEISYIETAVENIKDEINEVIDVAQNGTDEEKLAKVNEYIDAVTEILVEAGLEEADIDAAVEMAKVEIADIVAIVEAGDLAAAEAKADLYLENVMNFFELTEEEKAAVKDAIEKVADEIGEIVEIVENEDEEAAKVKITEYVNFLKDLLGITAEDEAKVEEILAEVTELIEKIKNTDPEEVKAVIDEYVAELEAEAKAELAKLGHTHYEATADSKYAAYGASSVGEDEVAYPALVGEALGVAVTDEPLNVDLLTYQVDAADVLLGIFDGLDADWGKYLTDEQLAVVETVWAEAQAIIAADWEAEGNDIAAELAAKIKAAVLEKLPEDASITEDDIDEVIDFCMEYIQRATRIAEETKDEAVAEISKIDAKVVEYAEKAAYAVVSYVVDTKAAIEDIQASNPDATVVVVGMYNPAQGLEIVAGETVIDAGEIFDYVISATNVYYAALAAINGEFVFADVSDATINGFESQETVETVIEKMTLGTLRDSMLADAEGHEYIKDQIVKALTCDFSVYEQLDAANHTVKCSICEFAKTEAHNFVDNVCDKCGYTKTVTPTPGPTPGPGGGGGGGISSGTFVVKFETNGGSAIASVKVKKGETVAEPQAPTKENCTFDGWYTDKALTKKYDFATPVTKSFTLYAKWAEASLADKFVDLDKTAWYYEYVKTIIEKGLMNGVSETEFAPNGTLTRGMFVTILHRVEGEPVTENAVAFVDVADGQWYTNAVKWANANGIVKGITETEFAPDAEVTREQMAAMIARYIEYKKIEVPAEGDVVYTDSAEISEYAKDAVKATNKLGILIGNADGSFAPKKNASRAEAAALFVRLLGVLEK